MSSSKPFKVEDHKCLNCGEDISKGGHFVPPCFGDVGFYMCKPKGVCRTCNGRGWVENSDSDQACGGPEETPCPTCNNRYIAEYNDDGEFLQFTEVDNLTIESESESESSSETSSESSDETSSQSSE